MTARSPYPDGTLPTNADNPLVARRFAQQLPNPDPSACADLSAPGLLQRYEAEITSGRMTIDQAAQQIAELRQHRRAMNGDRELPGELLADPRLPTAPMPFANRAEFRPDRLPGTQAGNAMRAAVEQADASFMSHDLVHQMRDNDPQSSTWARSDPNYRPEPSASSETSLRDSIEASAAALGN